MAAELRGGEGAQIFDYRFLIFDFGVRSAVNESGRWECGGPGTAEPQPTREWNQNAKVAKRRRRREEEQQLITRRAACTEEIPRGIA